MHVRRLLQHRIAVPSLPGQRKLLVGTALAATLLVGSQFVGPSSQGSNLISASVTITNPRLSFRGLAGAGNVVGGTEVNINTAQGAAPSTSSGQLQENDYVVIDTSGPTTYQVTSTKPDGTFYVNTALSSGHGDVGDHIFATQSGTLEVRFKPGNAIPNGVIRVLVPAHSVTAQANDGLPDPGTFDFGTVAPTVTCPTSQTGYTFNAGTGTPTATASAVTINSIPYHAFTCYYGGSGNLSADFGTSNAITNTMRVAGLINPAPLADHTIGTADRYRILVQNLEMNLSDGDQTTVSVGAIEAVKVSAEVPPQITFRILGLASGTSACGLSTNVTTTPVQVPFGELIIDQARNAAQRMVVSTNARSGYAVTAVQNDQLSRPGVTCTGDPSTNMNPDCIQDSRGDSALMSHTKADDWALNATKGFGFTLATPSGTLSENSARLEFSYDVNIDECAGGGNDCYRHFSDAEAAQDPTTLFSGSTISDSHTVDVCYKALVSATQAAELYENYVTYRATATF